MNARYYLVENNRTLYIEDARNIHLWDDVPNQIRSSEAYTLEKAKAEAARLAQARNISSIRVSKARTGYA